MKNYLARNLNGPQCAEANVPSLAISSDDGKLAVVDEKADPGDECQSPECRQLTAQFASLILGNQGFALTAGEKSTSEWGAKMRQFLSALSDWKGDDDAAECFRFKSQFYGELFSLAPAGPNRDLLLSSLLAWFERCGYQREHRAEWFYPVNTLIILEFANSRTAQPTIQELLSSPDPVIALYARLEQVLPRPIEQTIGLL